jgi:transcriptional regulator with XRE-family HTH domain
VQDPNALAATLSRLRRQQGLRQADVAERMGRSAGTVSRLEQDGVNPQWQTLLRYLDAIGVTLTELDEALSGADESAVVLGALLDEQLEHEAKRLEAEPGYRRLAAEMVRRFGGEELPPGMMALAELLDQYGERIHQIERQLRPRIDDRPPNGTNDTPVEG